MSTTYYKGLRLAGGDICAIIIGAVLLISTVIIAVVTRLQIKRKEKLKEVIETTLSYFTPFFFNAPISIVPFLLNIKEKEISFKLFGAFWIGFVCEKQYILNIFYGPCGAAVER